MRILYHIPSLNTLYAGRPIYFGYKNAFEDMGHKFRPLTVDDKAEEVYEEYSPDILFTGFNFYYLKFLDIELLKKQKSKGMKVFVNTPFWKSPMSKIRINEAQSISENKNYIKLIKSGNYGDVFFNMCEQGDPRIEGFEKNTGYPFYTVPLAADKTILENAVINDRFKADISYIGTYLSDKREFFKECVFPLRKRYDIKLYGQDWTPIDRSLGWIQRVGQYFNIPLLRSIQKPKLRLEDEGNIYKSSTISINVHEKYQKKYGGDCNERTFKIPLAGGFEITDDVACIRKYFKEGKEIVIAKNKKDWFEKLNYYIKNPEKRLLIIESGKKRVLKDHTYHNRVSQLISIYKKLN